jgi:hypothetical protein
VIVPDKNCPTVAPLLALKFIKTMLTQKWKQKVYILITWDVKENDYTYNTEYKDPDQHVKILNNKQI